jgi:hypothetical protein
MRKGWWWSRRIRERSAGVVVVPYTCALTTILDAFGEDSRRRGHAAEAASCPSVVVDVDAVEGVEVTRKVPVEIRVRRVPVDAVRNADIFYSRISASGGSIGSSLPEEREDDIDEEIRGTAANKEDSDWRHCDRQK